MHYLVLNDNCNRSNRNLVLCFHDKSPWLHRIYCELNDYINVNNDCDFNSCFILVLKPKRKQITLNTCHLSHTNNPKNTNDKTEGKFRVNSIHKEFRFPALYGWNLNDSLYVFLMLFISLVEMLLHKECLSIHFVHCTLIKVKKWHTIMNDTMNYNNIIASEINWTKLCSHFHIKILNHSAI